MKVYWQAAGSEWAKLSYCKSVLAPGYAGEPQCWLPACLFMSRDHQVKCELAVSLSVSADEPPEESLGISVTCDHFSFPRELVLENSATILKVEVCWKSWPQGGRKPMFLFTACFERTWSKTQRSPKCREIQKVIPIDLAGFEWNPKRFVSYSLGACASEAGEEFSGNRLFFRSYPIPKHLFASSVLPSFLCSLHGCGWLMKVRVPFWILEELSVLFLLHFPHWVIPALRFKHSSGDLSSRTWWWLLARPFSDTLLQTHHVPIATLGNNWDALRSLSILLALDYKCSCQQVNLKWIKDRPSHSW